MVQSKRVTCLALITSSNSSAGKTWIDTYGDMTLLNSTTGAKAYLYFTPCGWFGAGRYEVRRAAALALTSRFCLLHALRLLLRWWSVRGEPEVLPAFQAQAAGRLQVLLSASWHG